MFTNTSFSQEKYTKSIKSDGNTITYDCSFQGNNYNSDFSIAIGDVNLYTTSYSIDVSEKHYKLKQDNKILAIAKDFKQVIDVDNTCKQIDLLINQIFEEKGFNPDMIQSVFFHRAILKAKQRFLKEGMSDFLLHPGYFLNKTYFIDQRDYFIKTSVIRDVINSNPDLFKDQSSQLLISYINSISDEEIPFEKFYSFYVDNKNFKTAVHNIANEISPDKEQESELEKKQKSCAWWCPMGCGTDWGCCGNYSGCCFFTAPICYIHDGGCSFSKCQPRWICFPGCRID